MAADGTVWAGGTWGAAWFDGRRFRYFNVGQELNLSGPNRITSDAKYVYMAALQGLVRVQHVNGEYQATQLSHESMSALGIDHAGAVWVGCGTDVCVLRGDTLQHLGRGGGLPQQSWQSIAVTGDGTVWVRSSSHLFRLRRGEARFVQFDLGLPASGGARGPIFADKRWG